MSKVWGGGCLKQRFLFARTPRKANCLRVSEPSTRPDTGASYRQSKRELFVMIAAWAVTGLWVLGYNSQAAYAAETETPVRMLFGLPRWTVIGWLLPLLVAVMRCLRVERMTLATAAGMLNVSWAAASSCFGE